MHGSCTLGKKASFFGGNYLGTGACGSGGEDRVAKLRVIVNLGFPGVFPSEFSNLCLLVDSFVKFSRLSLF